MVKCTLCGQEHHGKTILSCPNLPQYVPTTTPFKRLPTSVCKVCLSQTGQQAPCCHEHLQVATIVCPKSQQHPMLCSKCPMAHKALREYLQKFHDHKIGVLNILKFNKKNMQGKAMSNVAKITSYHNLLTVNGCKIGTSVCPSEMLTIRLRNGCTTKLWVLYDSGSQHSLANRSTHPLITSSRSSGHPIQLSTITGDSCKNRQVVTLTLNKDTSIEALLVDSLNISHGSLKLPNEWTRYRGNWCDMIPQDSDVDAQLLIGSDTPRLHPGMLWTSTEDS